MAQTNGQVHGHSLTNYAAYIDPKLGVERIGHLDLEKETIQPLAFASGTPIDNLYQVIESQHDVEIVPRGEAFPASSVRILAPISGRDVLAIGKNYADHAAEFNKSGYDSSDKVDLPDFPVFFTKRATSIIANGDNIYPHPGFTKTLDFEGEIGVIIGKPGFRVRAEDAMDYVWGYMNINDMTARERQRDHKQFFIGKAPDTFCPMGPIAVPKEQLPTTLRVQTHVNGDLKQDSTSDLLIFSVVDLIVAYSAGQTFQPGDVIATGTPKGVGIGRDPPVFLKPGDEVAVSVTGLGVLRNKIAPMDSKNPVAVRGVMQSHLQKGNTSRSRGTQLTAINGKLLNYKVTGSQDASPVVFVHGLGGTMEYFSPLIDSLKLRQSHKLVLYDMEGHGLSATSPLSALSIDSLAEDLRGVFSEAKVGPTSGAILVAHSMGCLVAMAFAIKNPGLITGLVLMGPPPTPLPEAASKATYARAETSRSEGMEAVVDAVATAGTSEATKTSNPVGLTAVRVSLLGQDPEGYAKACMALAGSTTELPVHQIQAQTFIITGEEDKVSPPALCQKYASKLPACKEPVVLKDVGHWHIFEDVQGVARSLADFVKS